MKEEHMNNGGTNELYSSMGGTVRESGWKSGKKRETETFKSMGAFHRNQTNEDFNALAIYSTETTRTTVYPTL